MAPALHFHLHLRFDNTSELAARMEQNKQFAAQHKIETGNRWGGLVICFKVGFNVS